MPSYILFSISFQCGANRQQEDGTWRADWCAKNRGVIKQFICLDAIIDGDRCAKTHYKLRSNNVPQIVPCIHCVYRIVRLMFK